MKPHPRIRRSIKWGGLAASALLAAAWIGSAGWGRNQVVIIAGRVLVEHGPEGAAGAMESEFEFAPVWRSPILDWRFSFGRTTSLLVPGRGWFAAVPLWALVGAAVVPTVGAWRLDSVARRRGRPGHCPACRYDVRGLPAGGVCPECGRALAPA